MQWYQILSLVLSFLTLIGFGTVMKLFWEDRHRKKIDESEEEKKRRKAEHHKEIAESISEVFSPWSKRIAESIEKIEQRLALTEKCDLVGLRNSLMSIYYKCREKGYRTPDDSKNYREMHRVYNELGGNSFIDSDVSRWFDALALETEDEHLARMSKMDARNGNNNNNSKGND